MAASMVVEIDEDTLKSMVVKYLEDLTGQDIPLAKVKIETKSNQNYKSEPPNSGPRFV